MSDQPKSVTVPLTVLPAGGDERVKLFRGQIQAVHVVGIGGIGMSGVAEVLLGLGFAVSGSDLKESATVERLRQAGARVSVGHAAGQVGAADLVLRGSAIGEDNPEVAEARRRGLPVVHRAEMLAELMRQKYGVVVTGTHGKTTTTSLVAACLRTAGLDPTMVVGGKLADLGGRNADLGQGDYFVAEADESDGSFLRFTPTVALITNIEPEHMEHFGTREQLEREFLAFANKVPFYGFAVMCCDDPTVRRLADDVHARVVTYGFSEGAMYRACRVERDGLTTRFELRRDGQRLGPVAIRMPGRHNVVNAAGAMAAALELGAPFEAAAAAIAAFSGVERRFTVRAEIDGVVIVDDYGHHPTEIEATLAAARAALPDRRLIAVFQPHRFTRARDHWLQFQSAFSDADEVIVCPVYTAGEPPIDGIDHPNMARGMRERGHGAVHTVDSLEDAVDLLEAEVSSGDVVVTLGAGDVNNVCSLLAWRLGGKVANRKAG